MKTRENNYDKIELKCLVVKFFFDFINKYLKKGCGNADCFFKTNSNGEITLIFDPQFNRLSFDSIVNQIEINYIFPPAPCVDKFDGKDVRATGDWGAPIPWNEYEPFGKMILDSANCQYSVGNSINI